MLQIRGGEPLQGHLLVNRVLEELWDVVTIFDPVTPFKALGVLPLPL